MDYLRPPLKGKVIPSYNILLATLAALRVSWALRAQR
jgi:hypothetical protein